MSENNLEHLTEDRHFVIREKMQGALIADAYGYTDPNLVNNKQAYEWLKPNSAIFDIAFKEVVAEYPSFWDDVDQDFDSAFKLVKQKFIAEQSKTGAK